MFDLKKLGAVLGRFKYPALILLVGIILMAIPTGTGSAKKENKDTGLEEVLSSIDGVGRTMVLVSEKGVVVVCEGADNASVRLDLMKAVKSYTGFSSEKITILKIKDH